ncbi:MAG: DNA polymerase I [Spirochaetaceae bacterium]
MKAPLYLLDGYSIVFRSYFVFIRNPLRNPKGQNSSAVFGFFRTLFYIFRERMPEHFAVVQDSTTPTFRHERYEEYKATRDETPQDLKDQIPIIEEILSVLGVPMVRADGYEADDVMATLAKRGAAEERPVYIVSSDKDLLQLVEEPVRVLRPEQSGFRELTREQVYEDWGVYPEQIRDFLALVGDTSDNVPGVKGIGAKTAAKLLHEFGTLEAIYERMDQISSKSRRDKLADDRDNAFLSRELVTLDDSVPLSVNPSDLALPKLDYPAAVPYFMEQGMRSVVEELGFDPDLQPRAPTRNAPGRHTPEGDADLQPDLAPTVEDDGAPDSPTATVDPGTGRYTDPTGASDEVSGGSGERSPATGNAEAPGEPMEPGTYTLVTEVEVLKEWVRRAQDAGVYALDTETDSLDPIAARPVGISLSVKSGEGCYVALDGPDGRVMDPDAVREALRPLVGDPAYRMVVQNGKYDYKVLSNWGLPPANLHFDTMIAAWLLDTTASSYGMDRLAEDYLGYRPVSYKSLFPDAKRGEALPTFDSVALEQAAQYAAEDADVTYRLYELFAPRLEERGFATLFHEVEMPLVPLLAEMELKGILLRTDVLAAYSEELKDRLATLEQDIYGLVGREFNIASTKQLQEILFEERKLQPIRKTKTGYSTDVSVLQVLAKEDPVPDRVLQHRNLSKLKSTYVDVLPRLVNERTRRLHTNFSQTGTATGRLSSRDPNLQNIPIRDEEGRRIRSAFVPEEGSLFISADYAQIELAVLAHLSEDPGLLRAFREEKDVHRETGSMLFGVPAEEVTTEQRRIAKTINFGVMYGMSAFRLARDLEISRADADAFMEAYFGTYSGIKSFIDRTVRDAETNGYVRTLLGRERPLPDIRSRNRNVKQGAERIAVNTPIQGTAADIVKLAMMRIDRRLRDEGRAGRILLQVHDELILETPKGEVDAVALLVEEEMTGAVELSVPLRVSVEVGASWGDFHT